MLGKLLRSLSGRRTTPAAPAKAPVSPNGGPTSAPEPALSAPGLPFMIRPLEDTDLPALAGIFRRAISGLTDKDYSDQQRQAWVANADEPSFLTSLQEGVTIVADNDGVPVAFAQLHPADYLRMLYVDPDWAGLGIPTLLYQYLEDEARIIGSKTLSTHASLTAVRFFSGMGFRDEGEESVSRQDADVTRHRMIKVLVR